jgi:uncharacterized protein (TIGR03437 family)
MYSLQSQLRKSQIVVFSLLILLCIAAAPDRHWAKAPAAAQCPAITITPLGLPDGTTGVAYSQNINATGGSGRYTFSILTNSLPPGLTLAPSSGVISGSPTTTGTYSFQIRATESNNCSGTRGYTIQITCPTINIPLSSFGATVGASYSNIIGASGGTAPYTFSLVPPLAIPPGLTLSPSGLMSGRPTTTGTYIFGVRAMDSNGCFGSKNITANICPVITFSPPGILTGRIGLAYSWSFHATGGQAPYTYSILSGVLPPGLALSPGTISGTPTTAGSYPFTLLATDANGCRGEKEYTLIVACPTITLDPATLPAGTTGAAYNQTFSATGGVAPYSFSIVSGVLPSGLSLASNGNLTGTPTAAGNFTFQVRATDANGCTNVRLYTLTVDSTCPTITLNPTSPLRSGRIETPYNQAITATGGAPPYTFSLATGSALPAGLTLSTVGLMSGAPTVGGNFSFTIVATDSGGCIGFRLYNLFIDPCSLITINPADPNLPPASISAPYTQTFSATGGVAPYTWSLLGNPPPIGMTFNAATGVLSGSPTQSGTFNFSARAIDANGCVGSRAYTLLVNYTCPAIMVNPTNPNLPSATVGTPYTQTFSATGGAAPHRVEQFAGTPPSGLTLDFTTGILSGTPTAAGTFTFTVVFKDAGQCPGERVYTLVINDRTCPSVTINPNNSPLPAGTVGRVYSLTFTGTGGTAPYSFSITMGALPGGLELSSGGNLTGTPATAGTFNFNLRMTDASGCIDEANYDLVIAVNPVISVSAASFASNSALATESIIAAFGLNMATSTQTASTLPLPTELAGASLKVRDVAGTERLAPLFFVSPTQINYQIPPGTTVGAAGVTVLKGTSEMAAGGMEVANVSPGLFSADASGQGIAAAVALRVRADGTLSYEPISRYDAVQSRFVAEPIDLGPVSDQVFVLFYGTGWKFRSALSAVNCVIGSLTNEVLYAGEAPGFVGLDQVNARLSRSLAGRGEVDVVLTVDGKIANTVRIAIR